MTSTNGCPKKTSDNKGIRIVFDTIEHNIGLHDTEIDDYLKTKSLCTLIVVLKYIKKDHVTNSSKTYDLLVNEIKRRWYEITMDDLNEGGQLLVEILLNSTVSDKLNHTTEYQNNLGDFLARLVYHYLKENSDISCDQAKKYFDMLSFDHITINTFNQLITLPQYKTLRKQSLDFCDQIVQVFVEMNDKKYNPTLTPTNTTLTVKSDISNTKTISFDGIEIGDVFDIKDIQGSWYIGHIIDKTSSLKSRYDDSVTVYFLGWRKVDGETFDRLKITTHFAKLGSMTKGIVHIGGSYGSILGCTCCSCKITQ